MLTVSSELKEKSWNRSGQSERQRNGSWEWIPMGDNGRRRNRTRRSRTNQRLFEQVHRWWLRWKSQILLVSQNYSGDAQRQRLLHSLQRNWPFSLPVPPHAWPFPRPWPSPPLPRSFHQPVQKGILFFISPWYLSSSI